MNRFVVFVLALALFPFVLQGLLWVAAIILAIYAGVTA